MIKKYSNLFLMSLRNTVLVNQNYSSYFIVTWYLKNALPKYVYLLLIDLWDVEITTTRQSCLKLLHFLKSHSVFLLDTLIDIVVIDTPGKKLRFQVIYLLSSLKYNIRFRIRIFTNELIPIFSITFVYKFANWPEREIWDLYGILIMQHPDLRRLLTDYGFKGFPLRKDFPLTGFYEIIYNDTTKRLNEMPVSLAQEFRFFEFRNPWRK